MYIHVESGMTSRMRTILQAYEVAKKKKEKLTIIWPCKVDAECWVSFYDMFSLASLTREGVCVRVIEFIPAYRLKMLIKTKQFCGLIVETWKEKYKYINYFKIKYIQKRLKKRGLYYSTYPPKFYDDVENKEEVEALYQWTHNKLKEINESYLINEIYVLAYCGFSDDIIYDYNNLRFLEKYYQIADGIISNREPCVGVHVRRGYLIPHETCRQVNHIDEFFCTIDRILEREKAYIVLATDSNEVESVMKERYGDIIISQPNRVYNTKELDGMISSIIDFILLTKCKYIIGSECSVYSRAAADAAGVDLIFSHERRAAQPKISLN